MRHPEHRNVVNALTDTEQALAWIRRLERDWCESHGLERRDDAWAPIARELTKFAPHTVTPGMVRGVSEKRTKSIRQWLFESIRQAVIRRIEAELKDLEHELEVAVRRGALPGSAAVAEVEALIARGRKIIREGRA